jgi:hypothetical protein
MTLGNIRNSAYQRHFLHVALSGVALASMSVAMAAPLDEAREAQRAGDGAVLATLADAAASRVDELEAVRRARWLRMPELALEPLARLAAGRDPALAPEAAFVAHEIATSLDPLTLEAHEVALASLATARDALRALGRDGTARPDIRALASSAASHIDALSTR